MHASAPLMLGTRDAVVSKTTNDLCLHRFSSFGRKIDISQLITWIKVKWQERQCCREVSSAMKGC